MPANREDADWAERRLDELWEKADGPIYPEYDMDGSRFEVPDEVFESNEYNDFWESISLRLGMVTGLKNIGTVSIFKQRRFKHHF